MSRPPRLYKTMQQNCDNQLKDSLLVTGEEKILTDILLDYDLTIEKGSNVTVIGDIKARSIIVHSLSNVCIEGNINCGIYIHESANVTLRKDANVVNVMHINSRSRLVIHGNLLTQGVNRIKIANNAQVLITQSAKLIPSVTNQVINTIEIGDNAIIETKGDLIAAQKDRVEWDEIVVGHKTKVLINGIMQLNGYVTFLTMTSIKVLRDLRINGCLSVLENSCIETQGNLVVTLTKGILITQGYCSIRVNGSFTTTSRNAQIGMSNEIIVTNDIDFMCCSLVLEKSSTIRSNNFSSRRGSRIGTNNRILIANRIILNGRIIMQPCNVITCKEIYMFSTYCVLAENTRLMTNTMTFDTTYRGNGICIGSNSNIQIQGHMKSDKTIRIGSNCVFEVIDIYSKAIKLGSHCKVNMRRVVTRKRIEIGYGSSVTINGDIVIRDLILQSMSRVTIKGSLRMKDYLVLYRDSQLEIQGDLACNSINANTHTLLLVNGNIDTKNIVSKNNEVYINGCLFADSLWLGPSVMVVTESLFTGGLYIDHDQLVTYKDSMYLQPRVIVKKDLYSHRKIITSNKQLAIHGNLYTNNIDELDIQMTNKVITEDSSEIKKRIESIRQSVIKEIKYPVLERETKNE